MIKIALSTDDLARTRFAISPMLTTVLSIRSLFHPQPIEPMREWLETIRTELGTHDLPALRRLQPFGNYTVDFLLPFPEKSSPKFADELEQITSTPLGQIETEIQLLTQKQIIKPDDLKHYQNLASLRAQAVEELDFFWKRVMSPHWDAIHSVLEGDLMHHSRDLMLGGAINMFQNIGSSIQLESSNVIKLGTATHSETPVTPEGLGIVFVPNIISECSVWVQQIEGKPLIVSYRAFGAGLWKQVHSKRPTPAMYTLFGENRSRLLTELILPVSTKDLAIRLGVTSGAVSQQLSQLKDANLVNSNRSGRSVYYRLNQRGEQLLNLLESA